MSKQSRARAKRHNHKKKVGTGAMAPTLAMRMARMSEPHRYEVRSELLDSLHRELCKKQATWGMEAINLFYCELWSELMKEVSKQRKSKSKERTIQLIIDIKVSKGIE